MAAVFVAAGAVAGLAQDPCSETATINDLDAKVRAANDAVTAASKQPTFPDEKVITAGRNFVEVGKQFLEKYSKCKGQEEFGPWLEGRVAKVEGLIPDWVKTWEKKKLIARFDTGLKAGNWDEVYSAGKELLTKYPDEFRPVEIDLAAIGGEEGLASNNFKYADDSIRFAKQALADLEAGKPFLALDGKTTVYGVSKYAFKTKDEAIGWLNLYIGFLTAAGKKDTNSALAFLYKASQSTTDAAKRPVVYELVGDYYMNDLRKVVEEIKAKAASQSDTDTPEVAKQKVADIEALVAKSNGIAERAADAYARAYSLAVPPAFKPDYRARMKKNLEDAVRVRTGATTDVDKWIASVNSRPFVNPQTPITPITDTKPGTTTTTTSGTGVGAANGTGTGTANGSGVGAANGTGTGTANGSGMGAANGGGTGPARPMPVNNTAPVKPAAPKPAGTAPAKPQTRRQASVRKATTKKSA